MQTLLVALASLVWSSSAIADFKDYPTHFAVRCGPEAPVLALTLSASLADVLSCEDHLSAGEYVDSAIEQIAPLTITVGKNAYDARVLATATTKGCAALADAIGFEIRDTYGWYDLAVGQNKITIQTTDRSYICQGVAKP